MVQMPVDEFVDPHIHLFDLKGTPRPMQPLGKMFGWNESVLRFMAKKLMPNDTISFFGEQTDLLSDYLPTPTSGLATMLRTCSKRTREPAIGCEGFATCCRGTSRTG